MKLTSTRVISSLAASAAVAGAVLAFGAGIAEAATRPAGDSLPPSARTGILPGDVRVWDLTHSQSATASAVLPGDVRVWELLHPWRP